MGGVEGGIIPINWKKASSLRFMAWFSTFMAPISSCKATISPEHPQVGDGEGNGADAAAVAPTPSSTQKAARHWSRKVPFSLVSAACFCCERLSGPCEP